jgi:hypothetical protein
MVAEYLGERAGQLRAEQTYWEGVRRQANAKLETRANSELQEADADRGMYIDNEQEQLKSQISSAIFHLQEISQELERLRQLEEAEAREAAQREESQRQEELKDSFQHEDGFKEQIVKEDREKADALQKEEQLKAEALEKERQGKEFFEKKEGERLEALAKEEREKQEGQPKEQPSELDFLGEQLMDVNKEWQYVQDQIASEWDYVDRQIHEEMEYNVGQALEAVAEAGFEIGIAIANPVSQKETEQFSKEQKQQLNDFISDEIFQAAPAENKKMWLEEKFKEQRQALDAEFGERKDDWGNRKQLEDGLAKLQQSLLDTVSREQEIQTRVNAEVEELKRVLADTKERLEKANLDKDVLEEKIKQAEELAKKLEQQIREQAEKECQAIWEIAQRLMQEIETQRREEAEREEARRREEAARAMRNTFSF